MAPSPNGNSTFRHDNAAVLSVAAVDAPVVVPSTAFDERLTATYERLDIRPGLLQGLAGIEERRWWPEGVSFTDAASMAGEKAIEAAGIDRSRIGLLVNTSVCRSHLEPSAAVANHHQLGLASSCLNFDLANACLGFVNAMHLAATMIDAGHIDYALVVDGEGSRHTQEVTLDRLAGPGTTVGDFYAQFASLTLGSGSAAMVLGRADEHPEGHRVVGGVSRAASQHHDVCVGDLEYMRTDTKALLEGGLVVCDETWTAARADGFGWDDADCYVIHQVSQVHTKLMSETLGINTERVPLTFPTRGNIGPASVPFTLAGVQDTLVAGQQVLCLGMGSGINASVLELAW